MANAKDKIEVFASIALRNRDATGSDTTLYMSNVGGLRLVSAAPIRFRDVAGFGVFTSEFGAMQSTIETPDSVMIEIDNADGFYDKYMRGGSDDSIWDGSLVTIYAGGSDADNFNTTDMTEELVGYIVPGSFDSSASFLSFQVQDRRVLHDGKIATTTYDQTGTWDASEADLSRRGVIVPVVLGDWTDTQITAYRVDGPADGSNDTCWKVSDHLIGTLLVYVAGALVNGTGVPNNAPSLTVGEFILDSGEWNGSDAVTATFVGYPTTFTDPAAVTMLRGILTLFADSSIAAVTFYTGGGDGDVDNTKTLMGGTTPEVEVRAFLSGTTTVMQEIARLSFEAVMLSWVQDGEYRIAADFPFAPSSPTAFTEDHLSSNAEVQARENQNQDYANVIKASYNVDETGNPRDLYETTDVITGIIEESRTQYGQDVVFVDTYRFVKSGNSGFDRRLLWWTLNQEFVDLELVAQSIDDNSWGLSLSGDITLAHWRLAGFGIRITSMGRSADGTVKLTGRNLGAMPTLYLWTDDAPNLGEVNGEVLTDNTWRADSDRTGGIWL